MFFSFRTKRVKEPFMTQVFVHTDGLYRYALRLCGRPSYAEDLVQEALLKAYRAFRKTRRNSNHRAWVYTILRNTYVSSCRKQRAEVPLAPEHQNIPALRVAPDDGSHRGFCDEVSGALSELSETQRTAVLLCDVEGFSYGEIATVLGCPVGTVRSRIHHARRRLRACLENHYPEHAEKELIVAAV